jgi:hypothetical protein
MLNKRSRNILLFLFALRISQPLFCVFTPEQLLQMHDMQKKEFEEEQFEKHLADLKAQELKKKESADRMLGDLKVLLIACAIDLIRSYACDYAASYIPEQSTLVDTDLIAISTRTATRIGLEAATAMGVQAYYRNSITKESCFQGVNAATRLFIARYALPKTFQSGFYLANIYQDGQIPLQESAHFESNAARATFLASRCWNVYSAYKMIHAKKIAIA